MEHRKLKDYQDHALASKYYKSTRKVENFENETTSNETTQYS